MKKAELTAKTVVELKALARKKNVSLSTNDRKANIIEAIMAAAKAAKPAVKRAAASGKGAAKKTALSGRSAEKKTAAPVRTKKAEAARSAKPKRASAAKKPAAKKRTPAGKKSGIATPVREWKLPPGAEEPLMAQERIAESKYYTGPAQQASGGTSGDLPHGYGDEKIVLLSRDPFVAYAYWEVNPARIAREKAWFGWDSRLSVRIYDITGVQFDGRNAIGYFDQEISEQVGSWYFDFGRPSHSFCADVGLLSSGGSFLTIIRSNYVTMPRDGVSDVIDEEWMLVDEEFWKLYGYPEGFRRGVSSPEMQEMLRRRREMEITSPGMFPRERAKRK